MKSPQSKQRRVLGVVLAMLGAALLPAAAYLCPGDDGELSTFLNPAFVGAPPSFPPDSVQNYGETDVDAHILIDWDLILPTPPDPVDCDLPSAIESFFAAFLPDDHGLWLGSMLVKYDNGGGIVENPFQDPADFAAALRVPWHVPPVPGLPLDRAAPDEDFEYRARYIPLSSGVQALVLSPGTGTLDDFTLGAHSPCVDYDQDVLYWIPGTHGDPYYSSPMPWFEVEDVNTASLIEGELGKIVGWFRDGCIAREAMQRGMTVVVPEWSVAKRPLLWSLIQLIEIYRHLNSGEYVDNPYTQSPTGLPLRHRSFVCGGSYGGYVAGVAALYLDWLFHGAIARDANLDLRQTYAFQEAYALLGGQFAGRAGPTLSTLTWDPYMQMTMGNLERGFGGPPDAGLVGVPVDLAGLSLLSTDLPAGLENLISQLGIPMILVRGDEDSGMYSFYEQELGTLNPDVVELCSPLRGHEDVGLFEVWNQTHQVLGQLMAMPDIEGCVPLDPPPPQIDWSVLTPPDQPHRSEAFYELILKPDRSPAVDHGSGLVVERVGANLWPAFEVWEGLGGSGKAAVVDVTGDGIPEIYASTARGELVGLRFLTDPGQVARAVDEIFRTPIGEFFGDAEVVLIDGSSSLLVLPRFGPLVEVDLDPLTGTPTLIRASEVDAQAGRGLHGLSQLSPDQLTFLNDEGELIEVTRAATLWTVSARTHVEDGMTFLDSLSGSFEATYGSAHGFLKRYDFSQPGHPTDPADVGSFLGGMVTSLLPLGGTGPGDSTHAGVVYSPTWRIALFDDALQEVGSLLQCVGSAPEQIRLLNLEPDRVDLLSAWSVLPAATGAGKPGLLALLPPAQIGQPSKGYRDSRPSRLPEPQSRTLRDRLVDWLNILLRNSTSTEDPSNDPVAAGGTCAGDLCDFPVGVPGLMDPNDFADCTINDPELRHLAFDSTIGALERMPDASPMIGLDENTGAPFTPEWLVTLRSGQVALVGDVSRIPIHHQLFGEPFGSAFGLEKLGGDELLIVGPQDHAWIVDTSDGSIVQELENSTGNELETPHWGDSAHFGGFLSDGCAFGMYDGADLLEVGLFSATPLLAFACRENNKADTHEVWGGIKVVEVDTTSCVWEYDDPEALFRSDALFAPSGTSAPGPKSGGGVGNALRWADLDGNGTADLLVATHAGTLCWFENSSSTGFDASPTPSGLSADLGARILSLEIADLDADAELEILIGTEMDYDPLLGTKQMTESGSLYVFELQNGALTEIYRMPLGFGIYGLHHVPTPFSGRGDFLVAGMASGRFRLLEIQPDPLSLVEVYESTFWAPNLGAFNAIEHFGPQGGRVRLVMGSSGGAFAFDLSKSPELPEPPERLLTR